MENQQETAVTRKGDGPLKYKDCMNCGCQFAQVKHENFCEYCTYEKKREAEHKRCNDLAFKALGVFVAFQSKGIAPPKFSLNYNAFVILSLSGRSEEISDACDKFLQEGLEMLKDHEERERRSQNA